jgi:hypothetical protein
LSVSPANGSTTTDTTLTLTGSGFAADSVVTIGGTPAKSVTFVSDAQLTVVAAARETPGPVSIELSSAGKTSTLANVFTYVAPSGVNQPPVVSQIRVTGSRPGQPPQIADIGQNISLAATVSDNEASEAQLTYVWSAPGSFSPAAANTTWQVGTDIPTPSAVTVSLQVFETFVEGGVTHKQASAPGSLVLQVHNFQKEVLDRGEDFLTLFSNSSIPTSQVLHNFSARCDDGEGRNAEEDDVDENRDLYTQDFAAFRIQRRPPVTFNFGGNCQVPDGRVQHHVDACASYAVHWEVTKKSTGVREITNGIDYVSAVFENNEWKLCHSDFIGTSNFPSLGLTVPVSR